MYVRFQLLTTEELAGFRKVLGLGVQTEGLHDGDHTARRLRNWSVFLEQRTPDEIRLFRF